MERLSPGYPDMYYARVYPGHGRVYTFHVPLIVLCPCILKGLSHDFHTFDILWSLQKAQVAFPGTFQEFDIQYIFSATIFPFLIIKVNINLC